jgi:hypothetical protein
MNNASGEIGEGIKDMKKGRVFEVLGGSIKHKEGCTPQQNNELL